MSRAEDRARVRAGVLGLTIVTLVTAVALNYTALPFMNVGRPVTIEFREAGGLKTGDPVLVSGMEVGEVDAIELHGGHVDVDVRVTDDDVRLAGHTTAALVTTTVLGSAAVTLRSSGTGTVGETIPLARTASPYDVTAALSQLTSTVGEIDTAALSEALSTVSTTFAGTPEALDAALRGVNDVSATISGRDRQIRQLFDSSTEVTQILADRNDDIERLLRDGAQLLARLNDRRAVVEALFRNTIAVSEQIRRTMRGSGAELGPALRELDRVTSLLNRNRKKLQEAIEGLNGYVAGLGDAVSSGPYFDGYIANLTNPGSLAPLLSELLAAPSGSQP